MVSILVVSHSHDFAKAAVELVSEMKSEDFQLKYLGGIDDGLHFGSDPMEILQTIREINDEGVLIIADMGSSIMNTQVAISMLDENEQKQVRLANTPFFEGLLTSVVSNRPGLNIDQVQKVAESAKNQDKF